MLNKLLIQSIRIATNSLTNSQYHCGESQIYLPKIYGVNKGAQSRQEPKRAPALYSQPSRTKAKKIEKLRRQFCDKLNLISIVDQSRTLRMTDLKYLDNLRNGMGYIFHSSALLHRNAFEGFREWGNLYVLL